MSDILERCGYVEMNSIATKPSSRDDCLVAIISISTSMLHEPDGPRFEAGIC